MDEHRCTLTSTYYVRKKAEWLWLQNYQDEEFSDYSGTPDWYLTKTQQILTHNANVITSTDNILYI